MLADTPMEQREQILRDSCDQIVERSYTRKFSGAELAQKRTEYCDVAERVGGLTQELAEVTADIKGKIKPLKERMGGLLDEIKARGEFVRGDCFKFVDQDEGKVGFYDISPGANDMVGEFRDKCIDDVLGKIINIAPDIAIMEI